MKNEDEVTRVIVDRFSFLQSEFDFSEPVIKSDNLITTISYLSNEIALEFELDWKENEVFLLITRLTEGRLPNGYYVYNGKIVRKHLIRVLWEYFNYRIPLSKREIKQAGNKNKQKTMEQWITEYENLLILYTRELLNKGVSLFEKSL